ncbi:MAG: SRPBCC family protein [Jatrophihabitans sp.]|uniref:SRPBCC family protein n=1 Tax=Jatrophihabitans sp. TaxID=1932789 RepID=UPI003913C164
MWTHDYSQTTELAPEPLWQLLADVGGWVRWNGGIESLVLDGPVAVGTTFRMTPPGEDTLASTIVDLQPGQVITDLTELDGVAVRVEHRLDARADGRTAVTYRIEVSGAVPDEVAQEIGTAVSADFPDVIDNLIAAAETASR